MQLAIIRRRYNPYGGAERFIAQLAGALADQALSVSILSEQWQDSAQLKKNPQAHPAGGPRVITLSASGLSRNQRAASFARSVSRALKATPFSLVQSHERLMGADIYRLGDGVHAAWLTRLQGEFCARHRLFGALGLAGLRYRADAYHRAVLDLEAQMAQDPGLHYVANSELVAGELTHHYAVSPARITLIPNGVDTQRFAPLADAPRAALRERFGLAKQQTVVLFVGSGFRRKGAFSLVQALSLARDVSAWIVGKDKESAALERLIKKLGLSQRVALLGPRHDVPALMQAADVFCLPSLYDPSPNAVLEALACGLPVLATRDIGSMAEILAAQAGGQVSRQPETIAQALSPLAEPEVRAPYALAARDLALRFEQTSVIAQWMAFYRSQLARKQALA